MSAALSSRDSTQTAAKPWDAASVVDPVVRMGDKIPVHCPECLSLGMHTGMCSWSQARSGRVWTFYAEAIELALDPKDSHA